MKHRELSAADCAIAQALGVVGDWWTLLVIRDIAAGTTRFDGLQRALSISRKTLTERLKSLVAHGVLDKVHYSKHPPRFEYHLTETGRGLLPVLTALQDWGTRYIAGDGSLTATSAPTSAETRRVSDLVGRRLPPLTLPSDKAPEVDPAGPEWTVLFAFPGAFTPTGAAHPPGWHDIPGATGCTAQSTAYRDKFASFTARGVTVHGLNTQPPDELRAFAKHLALPFPLLSDADLQLTVALRLPTFRAGGMDRLKRLTLLIDPTRTIRAVHFPIPDPTTTADEVLAQLATLT